MTAHERLALALADALDARLTVPCTTGDGWLSDDENERQTAAQRCARCPLLTECAAAADETNEKFGVWSGVDRGAPRKGKTA